jgi:Ca2+-binding EF-hand superfamily protein
MKGSTMNAVDEYDIRDTFEALDTDKDGFLTAQEFYVLYLGLSFRPERITKVEDLQRIAEMDEEDSLVSVDRVLKVLEKVN